MIREFENIIKNDSLIANLKQAINVAETQGFPCFSYFGINYDDNNIISIKFYVLTFKKLGVDKLKTFFPFTNEIKSIYDEYESSKVFDIQNLGAAFGIKIDICHNLYYSFYQKKKGYIAPAAESLSFIPEQKRIRHDYNVMEFKQGIGYVKNYYLLFEKENINKVITNYNLNNLTKEDLKCVEFSEFQNQHKISLTFNNEVKKEQFIEQSNNTCFLNFYRYIQEEYNFHSFFPGQYFGNEVKSIYFFDRNVSNDFFQNSYTLYRLLQIKTPL